MLTYFVIGIYLLAALIALLHPRFALLLFCPLILCYPVWLLAGKLPLNIGLDDVFLVCLFVGSLIKSGGRLQAVSPVIFAGLFCVILFLGDISSIATGEVFEAQRYWKLWLKHTGLICLTFSMCSMTMTSKHIWRMVYSLLFGAMVAGALVIFYTTNPYAYNPFQIPYWLRGKEWWLLQNIGPFGYHDEAGGTLGFAVLIGYFLIRLRKGVLKKQVMVVITAVSFIGLLTSGSRSGWVFVAFPLIMSSLLSKQRILGIFLLGFVVIGIFFSLARFEYFSTRVAETFTQLGGEHLGYITAGRVYTWKAYMTHPKISWLLFGEGFAIMKGAHVHCNYMAMLKNTGCIGIIFWFVLYKEIVKKSFWLMKHDLDRGMSALFAGIFWSYIGYFFFFVPSTPMMWQMTRYTNFFLMTLVFLRYKQVESEAEYSLEEELYQTELDYAQVY